MDKTSVDIKTPDTTPWYYKPVTVWIVLLSIGPFGIPLLIFSPKFSKVAKVLISLLILMITIVPLYMGVLFIKMLENPELLDQIIANLSEEQQELINLLIGYLKN